MAIKILVSAQNSVDVDRILEEPSDILDLKNPLEGSLGAPSITLVDLVRKKIQNFNSHSNRKVLFSVAIGDFPYMPGSAGMAAYGVAHLTPDFIKIGLFGPKTKEEGILLTKSVVESVHVVNPSIKIVIVGYADQKKINSSVDPMLLPEIAHKGGADIVMLDTKVKNGISLFEHLTIQEIEQFVKKGRNLDLSVALAGSLNRQNLPALLDLHPDIIGVRSMVCKNFDRIHGQIEPYLISELKSTFQ